MKAVPTKDYDVWLLERLGNSVDETIEYLRVFLERDLKGSQAEFDLALKQALHNIALAYEVEL